MFQIPTSSRLRNAGGMVGRPYDEEVGSDRVPSRIFNEGKFFRGTQLYNGAPLPIG